MRQVITEREEVHRMSSKNKTEVLIDGKIYTLSGYESEEYLQRVATYINNKLAELKKLDGYARLSQELKSILLELNVADDYFKAKNQVEMVEEELAQKDQELYDLKHELISTQIKLEDAAKELEAKGITARVLDMHTIKPLDTEAVTACINEIGKVITVEDHNILNGLGSAVCEVAAEMGKGVVKRIGVQDQYGQSAPYERLLAMNGITVENIVKTAEELQ